MRIGVTGIRSTICQDLARTHDVFRITGEEKADFYVLAAGVIHPKLIQDQTDEERLLCAKVNLMDQVVICEKLLARYLDAKICIIGSESGFKGSYDMAYALSKAAIHHYVKTKKLSGTQRLFCIAPHIIRDSNMAKNRHDYEQIKDNQKYILSSDVAACILGSFYSGVNNEVIRIDRE